ncbi:hypothetical protein ACFVAV_30945 [Nocardia sp. NPDC057663]|uniref:hypothetical protein n=1 Tax=Nocardia sp. NPDC057663 TaxID=3346201 RepID=UPI003671928E
MIAEHAMAATEHSWPDWTSDKPDPVPPALVWAKDEGTDLRSNGVPRLVADPDNPNGSSQLDVPGPVLHAGPSPRVRADMPK